MERFSSVRYALQRRPTPKKAMIQVKFSRGILLPEHNLWLDPWDAQRLAFVSHAHGDHMAPHDEVILSEGTSRLMQARLPGDRREHILPFGQSRRLFGLYMELLPAGHIFGSAQIRLESDAGSLLYTGDFKLRQSLSAEPAQWKSADTLIMETTYGLPKYRMPPTAEVLAQMAKFCEDALADGDVPVLLGYSLGKSQEILCALLERGLTPMLHSSVHRMTQIYRELNPDFPSGYVHYSANKVAGHVLLFPPGAVRSLMLRQIRNRRTAVLTGWALDSGAKFRYGCDAAFPLTDHADYPDLVRYVELVRPKRVLTLHGFAGAFAADLRARGFEAWALTEDDQLELKLGGEPEESQPSTVVIVPGATLETVAEPAEAVEPEPVEPDAFLELGRIGERVGATSSKLKKIELLAGYLARLAGTDPRLAAMAAVYLTGRAFPQTDGRSLQTGWAVLRKALAGATGKTEQALREISRAHADAGKTFYEAMLERQSVGPFSLEDSQKFFHALQEARGPIQKTALLQEQLSRLGPLEASYLVKVLTGDLRIGLKEGLVEEAVAAAFTAPLEAVREANMLLGDIGETAVLACRMALGEATIRLFRPIKCMLASPEATAEAVWERLCEFAKSAGETVAASATADTSAASDPIAPILPIAPADAAPPAPAPASPAASWIEDKYDGIRAQLHIGDGRVEIFSRDLHNITEQFADLARAARGLDRGVALDGEIIAHEAGRNLTFFDLQKRLGRKTEDDLFLGRNDVPVVFRIFDLLYLDDTPLLRTPLAQRRRLLELIPFPAGLELTPIHTVQSAEEIEAAFTAARDRGNEGLIAKNGASLYTPGRRGLAWLKLKKELATLDVVVVGAENGHGKRSGVLSDYTFAVRDERTGELLTIGKAYSGVTDAEIDELTEHFIQSTVSMRGKYRQVHPEIVFEIAFDSVQPSTRHNSGLALRFPRIKAIRRDKTPAEIDTLSYARSLAKLKAHSPETRKP